MLNAERHMRGLVMSLPIVFSLAAPAASGQLLPPPGDGDIRAVYWELRNQSEVFLTLEPKSAKGAAAPLLTFTCHFAGRRPATAPTQIEVRTYAGAFWAPRAELWFLLDDAQRVDLGTTSAGLISGTPSDYISNVITIGTFKEMLAARRITGVALGFEFELRESQRRALGTFLERILSDNPLRK
jgi:hypothetical protein